MDRGAWWAIVRVTKSWTRLSAGVCVCTHTHILHTNTMDSSPPAPNRYVHMATVQFSFSVVSNSLWPHDYMGWHGQASLSITNSQSLLKLMSIESVMPSNHRILCHPLLPPSIFPSIRVFSNESVLHIRWPKYWRFSFSPSSEYSGLISFRIDWFDLLAIQGTLKSLLQHQQSKSIKSSVLSFFYSSTLTSIHDYWQTVALTRQTFVSKIMFLLFDMLSRLVIAFLPRSKHLLLSWLQSPSAVILESKKIVCHCFHCFPIYLPWSNGARCHDLSFLNAEF